MKSTGNCDGGRFIDVTDKALELTGRSRDDLLSTVGPQTDELARVITREQPGVKVMFMSGYVRFIAKVRDVLA